MKKLTKNELTLNKGGIPAIVFLPYVISACSIGALLYLEYRSRR